ncbi:MAG: hypothetical protein JXX14_23275 [Deltaproteobacteria bacterium]|nr:hypothetical protein [Deltaproteobacteria bacterium]
MNTFIKILVLGIVLLFHYHAEAQCRSDVDCKGKRICDAGTCIDPLTAPGESASTTTQPVTSAPSVAAPPAAEPKQTNPCAGVLCSGLGLCAIRNNAPHCLCNEGYQTDASGTQCVVPAVPAPAAIAPPVAASPLPTPDAVLSSPAQTVPPATQPTIPEPFLENTPPYPPPPPQPVTDTDTGRKKRLTLGHVFFWSGLALAGFGGISTGVALSAANEYNESFRSDDQSRARAFTGLMWTGFGSGITFMTIGIIMWATAPKPTNQKVSLMPALAHNEVGLVLSGRW